MAKHDETDTQQPQGILLKARNGDVIGFDETGLRMNLSDSVITDIGQRLAVRTDASVLGDVDAWNVRAIGDWYFFDARLPGKQGVRSFRRLKKAVDDGAPDMFADPTHALFAVLSLCGPRRAQTQNTQLRFPWHVVTAGDDLGVAGNSGTEEARAVSHLQILHEQTRDSLIADALISRRHEAFRALPVIFARTEADSAGSVSALLGCQGYKNFAQTVSNLLSTAQTLGLPVKVLAVSLDYTLEDAISDGVQWRDGIYRLMEQITALFADHGLRKPLFTSMFDAGTRDISDHSVIRGQWELSWNHGQHDFLHVAPSYMFAQDAYGHPTEGACLEMAEMEAAAIEAANEDAPWTCPLFLLAELEGDGTVIRCRAQALGALVLDSDDPLKSGSDCGFSLVGADNDPKIIDVCIASDDSQDILIRVDKAPTGQAVHLAYAIGHDASTDEMPANRGAVRDTWSEQSITGRRLHRWALPAMLPVHG
mgnify:CR=1 FL=1